MKYKYCAIVVLYEPDETVISNICSYSEILNKVFVIDNSNISNDMLIDNLKKIRNLEYFSFNKNQGLSKALIYGCNLATKEGYDFAMTMDQDSYFEEGAVLKMIDFLESADISNISIVAPSVAAVFSTQTGKLEVLKEQFEEQQKQENWVMTSGSLMNLNAYTKIGGFDKALFIEHIDIDIGYRFKKCKYQIIKIKEAWIFQRLGNSQSRKFCGRIIHPMFASPVRTYYLVRNQIYLIRKFGFNYIKFSKVSFIKTLIKLVFFEPNKRLRLHMYIKGIIDGYSNRMDAISRNKVAKDDEN